MPELTNKIGITAALSKYMAEIGSNSPHSPIYREGDKTYVKFDALEIVEGRTVPGTLIGFIWKMVPMLVMHQPNYTAPKGQVLNINGIEGRQEIQIKQN